MGRVWEPIFCRRRGLRVVAERLAVRVIRRARLPSYPPRPSLTLAASDGHRLKERSLTRSVRLSPTPDRRSGEKPCNYTELDGGAGRIGAVKAV
jgi:hypothetical protein